MGFKCSFPLFKDTFPVKKSGLKVYVFSFVVIYGLELYNLGRNLLNQVETKTNSVANLTLYNMCAVLWGLCSTMGVFSTVGIY